MVRNGGGGGGGGGGDNVSFVQQMFMTELPF